MSTAQKFYLYKYLCLLLHIWCTSKILYQNVCKYPVVSWTTAYHSKQSVWAEEESWTAKTRDLSILSPNWLPSLLLKSSYILLDHAGTYLLPAFSTRENLDSTRLKWRQEMLYTVKDRICIETCWWALPA